MTRRRKRGGRGRYQYSGPRYQARVEALGRAIEGAYARWPWHQPGNPGKLQRAERYVARNTVVKLWKRHKRRNTYTYQRRRGWLR